MAVHDAAPSIEPWLRGTDTDVPAIGRAVLHALQLANEDLERWCGNLSNAALHAKPAEAAPVAFHIRHLARSLDRLLTYAEGRSLNEEQRTRLRTELDPGATRDELFAELSTALADAAPRVRALATKNLEEARTVGKNHLPTTLGGLLVHVADHTQRHVGQAVTTAKIVNATDPQHGTLTTSRGPSTPQELHFVELLLRSGSHDSQANTGTEQAAQQNDKHDHREPHI
jgi:uncharacterized damage-inducible protein DinB